MTTTATQPAVPWWRRLLRVELSLTVGEILAIVAIVGVFNLVWWGPPPLWVGFLAGVAVVTVPDVWRRWRARRSS